MKMLLTQSRLQELLSYEPATGMFMWREKGTGRYLDRPAGVINAKGYRTIGVEGQRYYAHRLAWLFCHGAFPPAQVDHINLEKDDNRLVNLRLATPAQNLANVALAKHNTSGLKGVSFDKRRNKWCAAIHINNRTVHLGRFSTAIEAHAAYSAAALKRSGDFSRVE